MNTELLKALDAYKLAQTEYKKAGDALKVAQNNTSAIIDRVFAAGGPAERVEMRKANRDLLESAGAAENAAKHDNSIAYAVVCVAGENVAQAAANILLQAFNDDPKMAATPTHYKKFEKFCAGLLGDRFHCFNTGYGFKVNYLDGLYGHNEIWVCDTKNGLIDTERYSQKQIFDYETIKAECVRAAADAAALDAKIKELRETFDANKKTYKTGARYLLPYVDYNAIHKNFDFE